MIIPAVAGMQKPLTQMKDIEEAEIAEMKDVAQTVDRVQDHPATQKEVANAAARIELDTDKGMANEEKQQELALSSLKKAQQLIDGFHKRGLSQQELGEADQPAPLQSALKHIETVEKALERDTATSNTEKKIGDMMQEAKH